MRKIYCLIVLAILFVHGSSYAQICDPTTPVFTVNLSGNPNGTWISPSISRDGLCCTASGADVCIEFIITLDTAARGISFNIASGAVPPGALYYQVNCGTPVAVGQPICLSGAGPHYLTFCKPGHNPNSFSITSFADPIVTATVSNVASSRCSAILKAQGQSLDPTSVSWTAIPPNALYDSYLSCTSGCDSITVTPTGNYPAYVDYRVCGSGTSPCASGSICDTIRVFFINDVAVTVSPSSTMLCNGASTTAITATASGGSGSYQYLWSNGQTTSSISAGVGSYSVTVSDTAVCSTATGTSTVNMLAPIVANAGNDITVCANQPSASLSGSYQTANAAMWSGGSGSYNPNNTSMNAVYTPSASEIANGFANLILQTTSNQGCAPAYDTIHITIVPMPTPSISGNTVNCVSSSTNYSVAVVAGNSYSWSVTGGVINGANNSNSINVTWGNGGSGTVSVMQTNSSGCSTTVTQNVSLVVLPNPVILGSTSTCQFATSNFSVSPSPGSTYTWSTTNGTINGSTSGNAVQVNWNSSGSGSITVTETNSFGCIQSSTVPVTIYQPIVSNAGSDVTVCANQATVNLNGSFQNTSSATWTGGFGTFNPNNTSMNASYTPSASEIANGFANLILQTSSSQGCGPAYDTLHITIVPLPAPVVLGNTVSCVNSTTNYSVALSAGSSYSWTITGGVINGASNSNTINVTWGNSGSGSLSVTEINSNGCSGTTTQSISLVALPNPVITGSNTSCQFTSGVYSVTPSPGSTYLWATTNGIIMGSNSNSSVQIDWNTAGGGSVSVMETNSYGCMQSYTMQVNVSQANVAAAGSDVTVCAGQPMVSLNGSYQNTTAALWTGGSGNFSPNNSAMNAVYTPSANEIANGFANLILQTAPNQGCPSASDTIHITIAPMPAPVVTGTMVSCANSSTDYSIVLAAGNIYSWSVTGGVINGSSNANTINVSWGNAGSGTVSVTETNSAGCSTTTTQNISVAALPNPVVMGSNTSCQLTTGAYSISSTQGSTYSWSTTNGTINGSTTGSTIQVNWTSSGSGSVTVTETNTAGCIQSYTMPVTVSQPVIANAGSDITVCAGQPLVSLNGSFQNTNSAMWIGGSGTFNPDNTSMNASYTPSSSEINNGFAALILQSAPNQGCAANYDTVQITIAPMPTPMISGNMMTCANSTSNYSVAFAGGDSYSWMVTGGTVNGVSNTNSINVNWGNNTSGTLSVVQTNNAGCSAASTQSISLVIIPVPVVTGNNSSCQYISGNYSVTPSPGTTYSWTTTNGFISGSNSGSSVNVFWNTPGNGNVTLTETNSIGCTQTYTMPVSIYQQPVPSISGNSTGCVNAPATTYAATQDSNMTYSWSVNGGAMQSANGGNSMNVVWTSRGMNSISLTLTNANGCDSTIVFPVNVSAVNPASVQCSGNRGCPPLNVAFMGNSPAPGQTYSWSFGDQSTASSSNPSHIFTQPGLYNVMLITQDANGCADSANTTVQVYEAPQASFNHNFEINPYIIGESSLEIANTTIGGVTYSWTFGNNSTSTDFEPTTAYYEPGDYQIMLLTVNASGCMDTALSTVKVRYNEMLYVPNAFTPNGDESNDYFSMLYTNIASATVSVYNRWGHVIYSSDDKDFKWDGTFNGRAVELGVYVYRIEAVGEGGKKYVLIGTVSVIR